MAGQVFGLDSNNLPYDQSNYLDPDPGTIARGTAFYQSALGVATSPTSSNTLSSHSDGAGTTEPTQAATPTPKPRVSSKKPSTPQPPKATTAGNNGDGTGPFKGTRSPKLSLVDMRPTEDKDIPYMVPLKRRPGRPLRTDTTAPSFQSRARLANAQRALRSNSKSKNSRKGKGNSTGKAKASINTTAAAAAASSQTARTPNTTHTIDFEYRPTKHPQSTAHPEPTTPTANNDSGSKAPLQLVTPTTTPDRGRGEKNLKRLASQHSVADSPCKRRRIFDDQSLDIGSVEALMERLQRREAEKAAKGEDLHEKNDVAKTANDSGGQHIGAVPEAEEAARINQGQEEAFVLLED